MEFFQPNQVWSYMIMVLHPYSNAIAEEVGAYRKDFLCAYKYPVKPCQDEHEMLLLRMRKLQME